MHSYGAEQFQIERTNLITSLIYEACQMLIEEEIRIGARSVSNKISFFFETRDLNKKMFVKEQSIARNPTYKNIWKNYQKKQKIVEHSNKPNNHGVDEVSMRDQLDILRQEYIDILDERNFLSDMNVKLQKKLDQIPSSFINVNPKTSNSNKKSIFSPRTLLKEINTLLQKGPLTIIKKIDANNIVIKNRQNLNQEKIIFSIEEWKSIIEQEAEQ